MGTCESGACCSSNGQYVLTDQFNNAASGHLNEDDLKGKLIEIGADSNVAAVRRLQMLNEDFSHIYDRQFQQSHLDKVQLVQKVFRRFKWRKFFTEKLQERKKKEIDEPPKYFTRQENEETLQHG